jgi:pSer/pThr/pTyr-binding forkhead associated (FHA) protein
VVYAFDLGESCAVGRGDDNDLVLTDRLVSRHHLRLFATGSGHKILDLESTHGTYVNGERAREQPLHEGDQVQVGNVVLALRAQAHAGDARRGEP